MVAALAVLQGWQMVNGRKNHKKNPGIEGKVDIIINELGMMNQRLNDIWEKIKD